MGPDGATRCGGFWWGMVGYGMVGYGGVWWDMVWWGMVLHVGKKVGAQFGIM